MKDKITLLVIDSDLNYAKGIVECAKSHPAFLDAVYACTGTNGLSMIELIKPTVVIINFLLPELDAIGILRQLRNTDYNARPFIIVVSQALTSAMMNTATEYGADYLMVKPQPAIEVCNTITDLINSTSTLTMPSDTTETGNDLKITQLLHCMGIPAHLNGYKYIRSALKSAISDISSLYPITQRLYPQLGEEYNKTPQSIERSIRHAIKVSWERGNKKVLHDIFGVSPDNMYRNYPTNSEYIAMLADDLRLRLKHNMSIVS